MERGKAARDDAHVNVTLNVSVETPAEAAAAAAAQEFVSVEMCKKSIKKCGFFLHHYFMRVPALGIEMHPGHYTKGNFLKLDETRGYVVTAIVHKCRECLDDILLKNAISWTAWHYPIINCETLTRGMCLGTAWSSQALLLFSVIPFGVMLFIKTPKAFALLATTLLALGMLLAASCTWSFRGEAYVRHCEHHPQHV